MQSYRAKSIFMSSFALLCKEIDEYRLKLMTKETFKQQFDTNTKNLLYKQRIIEYIITRGPETLPALARKLEVSVPTISKMVSEMCTTQLLKNYGKLEATSGRHPFLYGLDGAKYHFLGVDVTREQIYIVLINLRGEQVQEQMARPFPLANTEESLADLVRVISAFIDKEMSIPREQLVSIGLNLPGRLNPHTGYSYSYFNFSPIPISLYLSEEIGIPLFIDNDSRASAYGEYMMHYKESGDNLLFVQCTWGLGLGMIINGEPYVGKSGFSGEFGHTHAYDNEVLCHCGKKGCLETEASGSALHRKLMQRIEEGGQSILTKEWSEENQDRIAPSFTLNDIIEAVQAEDILCIESIEEVGTQLGLHIANLINLLNPHVVVIGGPLARTGDYLLQPIRTAIRKYSLNMVNQDTDLRQSLLLRYAGVMGAALLARKKSIAAVTDVEEHDK